MNFVLWDEPVYLEHLHRRLMRKIAIQQGHWIWMGALGRGAYGAFDCIKIVNGERRTSVTTVHRVVYALFTGKSIPDGWQVHHKCRVRPCCNPLHLEMVPSAQHAEEHPEIAHFVLRESRDACASGHAMTGENVIHQSDGKRRCRQCNLKWNRARKPFHRGAHKTECKHGHPWVEENIRVKPNGNKSCKICDRLAARRQWQRIKDARKQESS